MQDYDNPQRKADINRLVDETAFAKIVETADGPAIMICGEIINIRSSDPALHVDAIVTALRRGGVDASSGSPKAPRVAGHPDREPASQENTDAFHKCVPLITHRNPELAPLVLVPLPAQPFDWVRKSKDIEFMRLVSDHRKANGLPYPSWNDWDLIMGRLSIEDAGHVKGPLPAGHTGKEPIAKGINVGGAEPPSTPYPGVESLYRAPQSRRILRLETVDRSELGPLVMVVLEQIHPEKPDVGAVTG